MSKYLAAMQKVEKVVLECEKGSFDYLKYVEFYKKMDKELL